MAYVLPYYVKTDSKIWTWLIPMCLYEQDNTEYILDNPYSRAYFKDYIFYFKNVSKNALDAVAGEVVLRYKISIDSDEKAILPIEDFVKLIIKRTVEQSGSSETLFSTDVEFKVCDASMVDFLTEFSRSIDRDALPQIAVPMQWLVYIPSMKLLTRLCFISSIRGKVSVKPFTARNVILIVDGEVLFETPEQMKVQEFKKKVKQKEKINDEWRRLVSETIVEEELSGISVLTAPREQTTITEHIQQREAKPTERGRSEINVTVE